MWLSIGQLSLMVLLMLLLAEEVSVLESFSLARHIIDLRIDIRGSGSRDFSTVTMIIGSYILIM